MEQLANLLKNFKVNYHIIAKGHYREIACHFKKVATGYQGFGIRLVLFWDFSFYLVCVPALAIFVNQICKQSI